ncbi:hypothetical protein [Stutzerimonas nitrititolerans]|uniref:ORF168 n=1 Tax=Stutzerimonas stutzeri TaxID=316 RepID=Q8GEC2_STUST|nr:hypothetical protein [Stutzerimonas nitrititolerans]AAN16064.1 ORF168 [Stutzerimonas stutzeri]
MSEVVEILQRELGITRASDPRPVLATVNVAMCTVFIGYDQENGIGFLGHFDFPGNTSVLPTLFNTLRNLSGNSATYKCTILGGNKYGWARSPTTRRKIHLAASFASTKYGINIQIEHEAPYQKLFKKTALKFDTRNGEIGPHPQRITMLSLGALLLNKPVRIIYEPK